MFGRKRRAERDQLIKNLVYDVGQLQLIEEQRRNARLITRVNELEDNVEGLRNSIRAKEERLRETDSSIRQVHDLVNNLAEQLGYERNPITPANFCPPRWVKKGK